MRGDVKITALPGISGQVIEGTILDPSTLPRMSHGKHGKHGPQPNPRKTFLPFTPTPFRGGGEGGNTTSGVGLRGSVCSVTIHSGPGVYHNGGAFFLTGTSFSGNTG